MFRFLLAGLLLGLALPRGVEGCLLAGLLLAFLPREAGRLSRPGLVLLLLGALLGLARGQAELPRLEGGELTGRWRELSFLKGPVFEGRLPGLDGLRVRGCGRRLPAPGSRFTGKGILLPAWGGEELRLLSWSAEPEESRAARASRRGRLEGPRRWLFPATASYGTRTRPLARALLFGDRRALPGRERARFRDAGLAHLLALSGLHVGLFLLLLRRVLGAAGLSPFRAEALLLPILPFLPLAVGTGPSIVRALIMAGYILVMRRWGGRALPLEALCLAGCAELLVRPASLFQPGFQLSYLATASLLAAYGESRPAPRLAGWRRGRAYLSEGLAASLYCTLSGLPVLLLTFDRLAVTGPLWNLLAAPVTAASLSLGWLALPLGCTPLAGVAALPAEISLRALLLVGEWGGERLGLVLTGFHPPAWTWIPWGLGLRLLLQERAMRPLAWALAAAPVLLGSPRLPL